MTPGEMTRGGKPPVSGFARSLERIMFSEIVDRVFHVGGFERAPYQTASLDDPTDRPIRARKKSDARVPYTATVQSQKIDVSGNDHAPVLPAIFELLFIEGGNQSGLRRGCHVDTGPTETLAFARKGGISCCVIPIVSSKYKLGRFEFK